MPGGVGGGASWGAPPSRLGLKNNALHYYIITLESNKFDISQERKNPINPICDVSLGEWLSLLLKQKNIDVTDIDAEDWGWYVYVTFNDKKYLVGFIAIPNEKDSGNAELIIQVTKKRSFTDAWLIMDYPLLFKRTYINNYFQDYLWRK